MTFVVLRPLWTFFNCKCSAFYEFNWFWHVCCDHEGLNLQLRLNMKPRLWWTILFSSFYICNSMFYILVVQSPSIAWFTLCNRVPFWLHALFYIRCVLSGDTSSDWIETNIHHDPQIRWMIWSQLNTRCDSLTDRFTEWFYMHVHDCWTLIKNVLIIDCVCKMQE